MNERFTAFSDWISETLGRWWVTASWACAIAAWTVFCATTHGSGWFVSQYFNFPLNLVTTVAELFIGFFLAAAANRVEKHNRELHQLILQIVQHIDATTTKEESELLALQSAVGALAPPPPEDHP